MHLPAEMVTKVPAGAATVASGSNRLPAPTHRLPDAPRLRL
jgi:hypothetical protein